MGFSWQASRVTDSRWLTMPELVQLLGLTPGRVHRLIEDKRLLAIRKDGVLVVPSSFLRESEPLPELRGTLVLLADSGYSDEEAMSWLLSPEENLGVSPVQALHAGRKKEVRKLAQTLAF